MQRDADAAVAEAERSAREASGLRARSEALAAEIVVATTTANDLRSRGEVFDGSVTDRQQVDDVAAPAPDSPAPADAEPDAVPDVTTDSFELPADVPSITDDTFGALDGADALAVAHQVPGDAADDGGDGFDRFDGFDLPS